MSTQLVDAIDIEIVMHRDIHFGGNFDIMLEYYNHDGVGVMPDFEITRIEELKEIQDESGEDLTKILPSTCQDQVHAAKDLYKKLRDVYEHPKDRISIQISDLILSEEEEPIKEIRELVLQGEKAVKPLIHIIDAFYFYDPLYPGYGRAPAFAAKCLAKIGQREAIPHLFNALGQENFTLDEALIHALVSFGSPAKDFLLKRFQQQPFSKDNEHAAIVLTSFPPDDEIATAAFNLLLDKELAKREIFASYLISACEGLKKQSFRQAFFDLSKKSSLPAHLKNEILVIAKTWL